MIRRSFRIGLRVGLLGGLVAAATKAVQARRGSRPSEAEGDTPTWPPLSQADTVAPVAPAPEAADTHPAPGTPEAANTPEPERPDLHTDDTPAAAVRKSAAKKTPAAKKTSRPGRKAVASGEAWVEPTGSVCPPSHPIKAKLSSKLYHLPGMFAYARTTPDRCYRAEDDAAADGLRKAKR